MTVFFIFCAAFYDNVYTYKHFKGNSYGNAVRQKITGFSA